MIQIKEEQKGVLNFHETKERQRAKNRSKLDLWIEKKFTIASVSILLKYLFSRFDLFITMRILRAIKQRGGGGIITIQNLIAKFIVRKKCIALRFETKFS